MSIEALTARVDGHDDRHADHRAEFGKVWEHIEKGQAAREDTNLKLAGLTGQVATVSAKIETLDAFIRGDLRKAFIGGVAAITLLAGLLAMSLAGHSEDAVNVIKTGMPASAP